MRAAIRVLGATVRIWYAHLFSVTLWSLLWAALSVTGVLFPPATAGLHGVARGMIAGDAPTLADFTHTARRYVWVSWRWALLNALAGVVMAVNLAFYGGMRSIWAGAALTLLAQSEPRLRAALRDALRLVLAAPLYTLTLLIAAGLLTVFSVSTVAPLAIFWGGFLALLGHVAVRERLRT